MTASRIVRDCTNVFLSSYIREFYFSRESSEFYNNRKHHLLTVSRVCILIKHAA